ncbi:MAG: RNA polymerase sigma factor [Bacteroidales bacterium]|nr:RNA polymerase sigma factor [Bacteroidales bacterium]
MEDRQIIELINEDQLRQAFNLIVRQYGERLYWHLRRMVMVHEDADDLLQNVYIDIWNALPTFRGDSSLFTWLYRIATNEALTFLKKRRLVNLISFQDESVNVGRHLVADPLFEGDKVQLAVQKAIASLPPKQRTVFTMRYYDELRYEDMAEILGTSAGALRASYHHAYNKVMEILRKELEGLD